MLTSHRVKLQSGHRSKSTFVPVYTEDPKQPATLRFQDSLPKLPVPSLEETTTRYLKSLRPLLNESELHRSTKAVAEFIKPGGIGHTLQDRLVSRSKDANHRNWLYDWWNEVAYLAYREPVVPYVSYFYSHRDDPIRRDPAKRAAAITTAALNFKRQTDEGTLEPEFMKGLPICMESYKWMFNASRVPAIPLDHPVKYSSSKHKHIIVIRRNQVFKVVHEIDGSQLSPSELEQQFRRIYKRAERTIPVGALTSENRDIWANARQLLLSAHPSNASAIATIESSSFVVCLDEASPVTLEERAHQYWHGDGTNRWYDKPLQFIVNDNGTSGFMGEHSMMDGTPTHRLNDAVNDMIFSNKIDLSASPIRSVLPEPEKVIFHVPTELKTVINTAVQHFNHIISQHQLAVQAYRGYGKELIKEFGCSPDAYVQMIIQLAYYKMYGQCRPTYESASTRRFQQGRTETCRTVSEASVAWCRAMVDPFVSVMTKESLFRQAINSHLEYISAASNGKGVDRHLFGLRKLLREDEEVPEIYQDPAYTYSSSWYLSTSQLSSEFFNGYGWSQVIDGGFGIAYMINSNSINFNIVSKGLGCEHMSFYIDEAATELRNLLMKPDISLSKL